MTFDLPTVFVLRADGSAMDFTWEIRRFGGIILRRADESFPTSAAARQAGLAALDEWQNPTADHAPSTGYVRENVPPVAPGRVRA
ncbi:MAG TPA: hypothetical protein VH414_19345 [Lichenihabitans sp.]|jgi:hypothetical protein|nr:hypothetical protein [Lichenihabitans sp.]